MHTAEPQAWCDMRVGVDARRPHNQPGRYGPPCKLPGGSRLAGPCAPPKPAPHAPLVELPEHLRVVDGLHDSGPGERTLDVLLRDLNGITNRFAVIVVRQEELQGMTGRTESSGGVVPLTHAGTCFGWGDSRLGSLSWTSAGDARQDQECWFPIVKLHPVVGIHQRRGARLCFAW